MTTLPPRAVLSEHFQQRLRGRRVLAAVFLTYQFDPGFFEQEVLPVLLDVPLSHSAALRLVQLEDVLRDLGGHIAVYYDRDGLIAGPAGSARLDVRRIPVRHGTGIFHAKNVFILVEAVEPDEAGQRPRSLLLASLSANITRPGWWENVEVCHLEELAAGEKTRMRDDVLALLERLRRKAAASGEDPALRLIIQFVRALEQRTQRSTDDHLHTHFYHGPASIPDFLEAVAGTRLNGTYLEIISPFFDDAQDCLPLKHLIDRFKPKETRVFLPRGKAGEALCRREVFQSVRALGNVGWGHLPKEILRLGKSEDAGERYVHAKVYRFFTQNPKREFYFIGSANLTSAAHQNGGNLETGFLVDVIPPRRPEFWLIPDERPPSEFRVGSEREATAAGTALQLRYHFDRNVGEAFWDAPAASPLLRLEARGVTLGRIGPLGPREWISLPIEIGQELRDLLATTSFVNVHGDGDLPALVLVQEEGTYKKPSLLHRLSAADILRYWALLTTEQRLALLEARAPELTASGDGADLVSPRSLVQEEDSLFSRFAGIFHSFGCLERTVRHALGKQDGGGEREARSRLFGKKYDSLGNLLDRIVDADYAGDDVDRYVIILCARQLAQEIARTHPDFWGAHPADVVELTARFRGADALREKLVVRGGPSMGEFLDWFEHWFLRRARPVEVTR